MFYQVFVADQQRNLLSFLWWENGDINEQLQDYPMNVHVLGGTLLPSYSNYALQKTAGDHKPKCSREVADTIRGNFLFR